MKQLRKLNIPRIVVNDGFASIPTSEVTERNDGPKCSREQLRHYQENWDVIIPPKVMSSLKRHNDILHGARSVNILIDNNLTRKTKDFDVYAKEPKKRAVELENAIDKCTGCDMAYVEYHPIPKLNPMTPEDELMSKYLYTVKTRPQNDGEVDYAELPRNLPKMRKGGILHETLEEAYRKAQRNKGMPLRAFKSLRDIRRIEEYWRRKGKKI